MSRLGVRSPTLPKRDEASGGMRFCAGQVVQVREDGGQEHPAVIMEVRGDLARIVGGTSHGSHRGIDIEPRSVPHFTVGVPTADSRAMGLSSATYFYRDRFRWESVTRFRVKGMCRPDAFVALQELDPLAPPSAPGAP
jgi:hypothetical protein